MNSDQKRALVKNRATVKSCVTRIASFVNGFQEGNINDIVVRKRALLSKIEEYNQIQTQLEVADPNDESNDADREIFEELCFETKSKIKTVLNTGAQPSLPSMSNDNTNNSVLKLPSISLPKFNGALSDFMHFLDTFDALIINNSSLTDIQRYYYLLSCLSGEPHQLIENLPVTQDNFKVAWELIRSRYHNPRLISDIHIKELLNLPSAKHDSPKELRLKINQLCSNLNAVEALKVETPPQDMLLSHLLLERISINFRKQWETRTAGDVQPKLKDLIHFLEHNCQTLEIVASNKMVTTNQDDAKRSLNTKGTQRSFVTTLSCPLCKSSHLLHKCARFKNLSVSERMRLVKECRLCYNYLRDDHRVNDCRSGYCIECNKSHHTLLHDSNTNSTASSSTNGPQHHSYCSVKRSCTHAEVLLATAVVDIKDSKGNVHQCRALLDSASQMNFISRNLVDRLGLQLNKHSVSINGISNVRASESSHLCQLHLSSRVSDYNRHVLGSVLDSITGPLPSFKVQYNDWQLPTDLPLADPKFYEPSEIDVLLGATVFFEILKPGQLSRDGHPTLQNTQLGWILSGHIPQNSVQVPKNTVTSLLTVTDQLHSQVERFWEQEELTDRQYSMEETLCEEHFREHFTRNESGRFKVRLLLHGRKEDLGDSFEMAQRNFGYIERRLEKQRDLKREYVKFMDEYLQLGHMERVCSTNDSQCYYMPHHAVVKETSVTTKVRVVFNASAKTTSSVSLNEIMMVGPTIQDDLFSILLRFRNHRYALTADIEKMYRQIQVHEDDRNLQRIVWRRNPNQPLEIYRLTTVTYGTAAAPYLAIRCLAQIGLDHERTHPKAAEVIRQDFYVDDLLTGANTIEEAICLYEDLTLLLSSGGFPIRKWRSNNSDLLKNIPEAQLAGQEPHWLPLDGNSVKILGLNWHPNNDTFQYGADLRRLEQPKWTKRTVLSTVAAIYDPMGLLGPIIVLCKCFIQAIGQHRLDWDQPLPLNLTVQWKLLCEQLPELNSINVPRRVIPDLTIQIQLHGFCDTSQKAYGACVYLRCTTSTGNITVCLLSSKPRLAPLKQVTLPRLELSGALLLSKLMVKVHRALNLNVQEQYFWTDSTIVLAWINGNPASWKTYMAKRVAEIQQLTSQGAWKHVLSEDNPADMLSRGTDPHYLKESTLWWAGPTWLSMDSLVWPQSLKVTRKEAEIPEKKIVKHCFTSTTEETDAIFSRFSNWNKLQRVIAYVCRFASNTRHKTSRQLGSLTTDELNRSFKVIVRIVQRCSFGPEIFSLQQSEPLSSRSKLLTLHPYLDRDNLLRVGGRLENADAPFEQKHPLIMPPRHHVTKLIICNEHVRLLHAGTQLVLASLRQRIWIANGKSVIRNIISKCVTCFKTKAAAASQIMGQLPAARVTPSKRFSHTGVDYGGPLQIKHGHPRSRAQKKCYKTLFVCMTTKAVHIELVSDLTTEAFIAALRRFMSRRGRCSHIYSDNGTCFTGAKRKLDERERFLRSKDYLSAISEFMSMEGLKWHFIPPHAPNFGGLWEAGIKSIKGHLKKVIGNSVLTFEEMTTLLTQIQACLNSRPITPLPNTPDEYAFLTPGHFLVGEPLISFSEPVCISGPSSRLSRWQLVQRCREQIWRRWSTDYLSQLQQRSKWLRDQSNLQVG